MFDQHKKTIEKRKVHFEGNPDFLVVIVVGCPRQTR